MTTYSWYKSKEVWAFVIMFFIGGVQAIGSSLNPNLVTVLMAVLGLAGSYFHVSTARSLGASN